MYIIISMRVVSALLSIRVFHTTRYSLVSVLTIIVSPGAAPQPGYYHFTRWQREYRHLPVYQRHVAALRRHRHLRPAQRHQVQRRGNMLTNKVARA